ncbi:MAG TPA: MutL protein [Clostridiales bacterium]|nr:MutL protein [Clostridiales bacterium]
MNPVLLIDFGSTYTKLTAVDIDRESILGTSQAYSTVQTDINDGLQEGLKLLEEQTGPTVYNETYACSSAAGGLRMITSGLVPDLTSKAAKMASLGAGAKMLNVYSFELTEEDIEEIRNADPDIILLVGGTDGGNQECIIHNSKMLAALPKKYPIIIAGNRTAAKQCAEHLEGFETFVSENVMPALGTLNVKPAQDRIRDLFLRRIVQAKGLSRTAELLTGIIMPTPAAVLQAMELLARGCEGEEGIGELIAVDVGGATTDVYSIAAGLPANDATFYKGLPEPYAKRTVEGDIGMRYSIHGIVEAAGDMRICQLSGLPSERIEELADRLSKNPDIVSNGDEELEALDYALASMAIETAVARHAGTIEETYTIMGKTYIQEGKDLRDVSRVILTGGSLIHTKRTAEIASHALYSVSNPMSLRPVAADIRIDRNYIVAAMGLLSTHYPEIALRIMKKELENNGREK